MRDLDLILADIEVRLLESSGEAVNRTRLNYQRLSEAKVSRSELDEILADHQLWLDSDGRRGKQADLRGASLQKADLRRADLQEVDLRRADLRGANLQKAYLRSVRLYGANLQGANLSGADLTGAKMPE